MTDVPEIDVDELARLRDGGVALIDVRQPDEYVELRVPGAVLIPLDDIDPRLDEVPTDATVYVICRTGARSRVAAQFLRRQGIDAVNVAGGIVAWAEAGLPTEAGE